MNWLKDGEKMDKARLMVGVGGLGLGAVGAGVNAYQDYQRMKKEDERWNKEFDWTKSEARRDQANKNRSFGQNSIQLLKDDFLTALARSRGM